MEVKDQSTASGPEGSGGDADEEREDSKGGSEDEANEEETPGGSLKPFLQLSISIHECGCCDIR